MICSVFKVLSRAWHLLSECQYANLCCVYGAPPLLLGLVTGRNRGCISHCLRDRLMTESGQFSHRGLFGAPVGDVSVKKTSCSAIAERSRCRVG